jgi:hypothetical protein
MRRFFPESSLFAALLIFVVAMVACGGGTPTANVVDKITIATPISLNQGDVAQLSVTATDKNGATAIASFTYTSSNNNLVSVSTSGLLCAGTWDANYIVCTPTTSTGSANITVTSSNGKSATAQAYVHYKVDAVLANGPNDCLSSASTAQLTATALSNNPAVCSQLPGSPTPPCTLPATTIGQATWISNNTNVVTVDNTVANSGTATAVNPGTTTVYASVSNNNSPALTITTCPVVQLNITSASSTDPFSLAKGSTRAFNAVAIDSKGTTLTTVPLIWSSSQPFAMAIAAGSPALNATATAQNPGTSSLMASCSPPTCNIGLNPVYSNVIVGTTTGSSNDTLYAASKDSLSLVPIDLANNNTVGSPITLPQKPNSLIADRVGSTIVLGSDSVTGMLVNTSTSAITSLNIPGIAMKYSPDNTMFGYASTVSTQGAVDIVSSSSGGTTAVMLFTGDARNLALDFAPDSKFALLTQQSTKLVEWNASNQVLPFTLGQPANDVNFLAGGGAAYLANGSSGLVSAVATCNPATQVDTKSATNPVFVRAIPNNSGMLVLDPPNVIVLSPITVANISPSSSCPPVVNSVSNSYPAGITIPDRTKAQMLVTPDSTKALITNGSNLVYIFDIVQHTTKAVALAGSVTESYEADVTLDSRFAYIGTNDGTIHKIDLVAGTDSAQINPGLKQSDNTTVANPHFVALKHKQ